MMLVEEYLTLDLLESQTHLDLSEGCFERGGISTNHRGVLVQYLNTPIYGKPADLCHKCNNGKCSNPKHLYWGSHKENMKDEIDNGTHVSINSWQKKVEKYGYEQACKMNVNFSAAAARGGKSNKGKLKSESHKDNIRKGVERSYRVKIIMESEPLKFGWISRASEKLNISHTEIRRFAEKEGIETYNRSRK